MVVAVIKKADGSAADSLLPVSSGALAAPIVETNDRDLFGHPRGLMILAGTEFWERLSFQGMVAVLVLYMGEQLLRPGHVQHIAGFATFRNVVESVTGTLSTQALASQIFGLYVGLIGFTPIFGGLLGDRLLGQRRTVILGAILMAGGHFCMAFDRSFLLALLLLICGAGCLRGNLSSQVGNLYSKNDRRRVDGFQIYVAMINTGFFVGPIVTGALAQSYGWHYGFGFAGLGMLVGLIIYIVGQREVPPDTRPPKRRGRAKLSVSERRRVLALCLLLPLLTLFWVAQSQVWNTYNLWVRDHLDLTLAGWNIPVPWMQSVDGLAAVVLVPPLILLWRWQAKHDREPDDLTKLGIGCMIFGVAMSWLAAGGLITNAAGKVPLLWALGFNLLENTGYLFVQPVAVALYARTAPVSINALMVSVYSLSLFAGSVASGRLGGLYERLSPAQFWLLHAAIVATGGLLLFAIAPIMRRVLPLPLPRAKPPHVEAHGLPL